MLKSIVVLLAGAALAMAAPPVPVIFDTDIGNDVDDCLALAILHAFESRGEARIAAVTITKDNPWAPRLASAINIFYGRPEIPVGVVRDGKTRDDGFLKKTLDAGHYKYNDDARDAVTVLRRALEAEKDASVVIVQVGFSTNLARLLDSPGGRDLAAKKVQRLVMMAGDFTGGGPEYNVVTDIPAAQKVAREFPTPVTWSGFEVGRTIKYPGASIERDFGPPGAHPVGDAYRFHGKMPYDHDDLGSDRHAVRRAPRRRLFHGIARGDSRRGRPRHDHIHATAGGRHRILSVDEVQRTRILEAFLWLCTQPPQSHLGGPGR